MKITGLLTFVILVLISYETKTGFITQQDALYDLDYLREHIKEIHPDRFIFRTKAQKDSIYSGLRSKITSAIDTMAFYDLVAEYTTFFKDGHTFPSMGFLSKHYQRSLELDNTTAPLKFDFKDDYFYIKEVYSDSLDHLVGKKLIRLNNHNSEYIIDAFQKFYAKRANRFDNAHARMFGEYFWRAFGPFSNWTLEYEESNGKFGTIELAGSNKANVNEKAKNDGVIPSNTQMPEPYSFEYIFDGRAALLTINFMAFPERFKSLMEKTMAEIQKKGVEHFIIDMRDNGGGTSQIGDVLYSYISDKPYHDERMYIKMSQAIKNWYETERTDHPLFDLVKQAKVGDLVLYPDTTAVIPVKRKYLFSGNSYLITSSKTFSSGHMFAGIFKCTDIGIMVGQETGQATMTVGDAFSFKLPKSGIEIHVSYKIFESACELSYTDGFRPHYEIRYNSEELKSGVDKEMELIRGLFEKD